MRVDVSEFGQVESNTVEVFTLQNSQGMQVEILTYGGIIHRIAMPDGKGNIHDCVQSYSDINGYVEDPSYRGAIVGRFANRIGHGTFALNGIRYELDQNGGDHNLHGGLAGFHKKLWKGTAIQSDTAVGVELTLTSEDGEGGFPGNLEITAIYTLSDSNTLTLTMQAKTDAPTPISMTQHAYFTLSKSDSVESTSLFINASQITEADATLLPTGKLVDVANTPFDFTTSTVIGERSQGTGRGAMPLYDMVGGYDHNYVLNQDDTNTPQAVVYASDTGIEMELHTNLPGIQFYTGSLNSSPQLGALCLEPQHYPDAPNRPEFPNCIATPDKPFEAVISYQFALKNKQ